MDRDPRRPSRPSGPDDARLDALLAETLAERATEVSPAPDALPRLNARLDGLRPARPWWMGRLRWVGTVAVALLLVAIATPVGRLAAAGLVNATHAVITTVRDVATGKDEDEKTPTIPATVPGAGNGSAAPTGSGTRPPDAGPATIGATAPATPVGTPRRTATGTSAATGAPTAAPAPTATATATARVPGALTETSATASPTASVAVPATSAPTAAPPTGTPPGRTGRAPAGVAGVAANEETDGEHDEGARPARLTPPAHGQDRTTPPESPKAPKKPAPNEATRPARHASGG